MTEAEHAADDSEVTDELPSDLDPTAVTGPYLFPNNSKRRIPGYIYLLLAVALVGVWIATRGSSPVLINGGFLIAAGLLVAIGVFQLVAGWNLDIDEGEALVRAGTVVGFPVGHASAQMAWRGLLSRPTWRLLVYSAEDPPRKRGLVLVDGVDGEVVSWFVEDNPEDWTQLDGRLDRT